MNTTTENRAAELPQYGWARVLGIWAIATGAMGLAAWVVGPAIAANWDDGTGLLRGLLLAFTVGLLVQLAVVLVAVRRERGSLSWQALKTALWLRTPYSPRAGERRKRVWWMFLPWAVVLAATTAIPNIGGSEARDLATVIETDAVQAFLADNWAWFALTMLMFFLNTVAGEELLFRGLLLPRMQRNFGRWGWLVNAVLFAGYHVHQPWTMLNVVGAGSVFAFTSQRYRSAWFGIALHSIQSVLIGALLLSLVLGVETA